MKTRHCDECANCDMRLGDGMTCDKGHKPRFYLPREKYPYCNNWGYKRKCEDYEEGTPKTTKTMNQQEPTLMEVFPYMGEDLQVVELELLTEKGTCGEDEILYHCMNRHGEITELCGWEIAKDREEAANV